MRQNATYRSGPVGTPYIPLTGVRMCHTRAGLCVGSMHQPTAPCAATTAVEHMLLCSLPRCSTICHKQVCHRQVSHRFSQILTDSSTAHAASYHSSSFHAWTALSSCQCVARYHYGTLTSVHSTFAVYPHLSLHYKTRCIFSQILT
eukprot:COSAG01_NODE_32074_length_586_cov_15.439425_1_plen_145_part_01